MENPVFYRTVKANGLNLFYSEAGPKDAPVLLLLLDCLRLRACPERVEALIVQDAVGHNEGLGKNWKMRRVVWADRATHEDALQNNLLSMVATKTRHVGDDPRVELYDPDLWTDEYAF